MFSYIDPKIRQELIAQKKLIFLDKSGTPVAQEKADFSLLGPVPLPVNVHGRELKFMWWTFVPRLELSAVQEAASRAKAGEAEAFRQLLQSSMTVNSLLITQGYESLESPLVRVHSCCVTGDVFGSRRCECGPQLADALEQIAGAGGALVYMSGHEGRGIGLWAKAITYMLQDDGQDTYQANRSLGLPEDSRDFHAAGAVLRYFFKGKPIRLLSNNPLKKEQLEEAGQPVSAMVQLFTGLTPYNRRYMESKRENGHLLPKIEVVD